MNSNTNYPDAMISVSLDRQAEKVRAVQAYGSSRTTAPAAQDWQMDQAPRAAWPVAQIGGALVAGMAVIGMLLVYVAR